MNPLDVILGVLATVLAAYVLLVIGLNAIRPARRAGAYMRHTFTQPFASHFGHADQQRRLHQLDDEVRRALGVDAPTDAQERADVVQAAAGAQYISILNQNLRESASRCLSTHWAVAQGLMAVDMNEAARHPLSRRSRDRVVDLSELLSQHLETYPLLSDSPELIRLLLGIRSIGAACTVCPYFTATVANAPRVCPTARAMGHRPAAGPRPDGVIDADVIDQC